jgi:hypothetical protein
MTETYFDYDFLVNLTLAKSCGNTLDDSQVRSAKNLVKSLAKGSNENTFVYEQKLYKITKDDSERVGRYYPKRGGLNYQNMGRRLRRILTAEKYVELDMKNAQPMLLLNKFPDSPALLRYIRDREAILADVVRTSGCTRDVAKELFIMMMFGGKVNSWKEDYGISTGPPNFCYEL